MTVRFLGKGMDECHKPLDVIFFLEVEAFENMRFNIDLEPADDLLMLIECSYTFDTLLKSFGIENIMRITIEPKNGKPILMKCFCYFFIIFLYLQINSLYVMLF